VETRYAKKRFADNQEVIIVKDYMNSF